MNGFLPYKIKLHDLPVGDVKFTSEYVRKNLRLVELFHNDVIKHIKKEY